MRKIEDFTCGNCGEKVVGNGYTDHCPKCLWGKHVDFEVPGDRASDCQSLMTPIEVQYTGGKYKILYKCNGCSHKFWVKAGESDNVEKLIELTVKY